MKATPVVKVIIASLDGEVLETLFVWPRPDHSVGDAVALAQIASDILTDRLEFCYPEEEIPT